MPKKRQPKEIWFETRLKILERDGYKCIRCTTPLTEYTAEIDHIQSGLQGSNKLSNLRSLCKRCHALRADLRHNGMRSRAIRKGIIPPNWREHVWEG